MQVKMQYLEAIIIQERSQLEVAGVVCMLQNADEC